MHDLDLIPADYRRLLSVRSWLKRFALGYGTLLLAVVAGLYLVRYGVAQEEARIGKLQADKFQILAQKATLEELEARAALLAKHLAVLSRLRGGVPADHAFRTMDRALNDSVWFLDWKFMRAGESVPAKKSTTQRGYFIIIQDDSPGTDPKAWKMLTHMELKGQALDHSALAEFVLRLGRQPEIAEVKILDTRTHRYAHTQVVDFRLAIIVDEHPQGA